MLKYILLACGVLMASNAHAATVHSRSGVTTHVSTAFAHKAQCVVDGLEAGGVHVKSLGGYGHRKFKHSRHASGNGLDVNQKRRDVTWPNVPRSLASSVAHHCGVVSGGDWRGTPDNGHFDDGANFGHLRIDYAVVSKRMTQGLPPRDTNRVW